MRAIRGALLLTGVGFGLWGLWLMRDFTSEQLVSIGIWFGGAVVLHDAILAPITVVLGVIVARHLPGHFRAATGTAFLIWATLTVVFIPVLGGQGGSPDNATILGRPYLLSWIVMTIVIAAVAGALSYRRRQLAAARAVS
ncbi:hypothetical protein C6I20_16540 [Aeromicrobium sp. A1-2]|uniref:hypothetical protein n=1 Tax=Aeromicrobium sp. A1-2 TaxID=2107713 RepID=UPI000E4B22BE|nr:hypothetical protein [Aeromicrobium sp. A1-2]AXT86616.1 hypothetical protein C6I20_16540 [Aeromicrobium sp. A1-2]